MRKNPLFRRSWGIPAVAVALSLLSTLPASAQFPGLTLPPGGDNQRSVVTQYMGLVSVTVDYNSPDVTSPTGEDRTGKIWGQLVPYGMPSLGFGTCTECPWRVGANENTIVTFSHDVHVQGKPLAAGNYGLHMAPGEDEWTVIFSHNSTAWGSFFYAAAEDALRVQVKPKKADFREWLTFDFVDRQLDSSVLAMHWENLEVPIEISVPDLVGLYVKNIQAELQNSQGFTWQNWNAAAQFLLQRDTENQHGELALEWADQAINAPFGIGAKNFTTLQTKSLVLQRQGKSAEAKSLMAEAMEHPTATPLLIHAYARTLVGQGETEEAMEVFRKNAEMYPDTWPVELGLARGYSALGNYKKALAHAEKALDHAPAAFNRQNVENIIQTLKEGKDVN